MSKKLNHVYVPGYFATMTAWNEFDNIPNAVAGFPLAGKWVEKPSYFRQVTYGHKINDVIHAKLISSPELGKVEIWDGVIHRTRPESTYNFKEYMTTARQQTSDGNRSTIWYTRRVRYDPEADPNVNNELAKEQTFVCEAVITPHPYNFGLGSFYYPSLEIHFYVIPEDADLTQEREWVHELMLNSSVQYDYRSGTVYEEHDELLEALPGFLDVVERIKSFGYTATSYPPGKIHSVLATIWSNFIRTLEPSVVIPLTRINARYWRRIVIESCEAAVDHTSLRESFLLGEVSFMQGKRVLSALQVGMDGYQKNWLIQHAYKSAVDEIPQLSQNEIQNLCELVKFVKTLVVDRKVEIPKRLSDAWLAYRYELNTSLLDWEEAWDFIKRMYDWSQWGRDLLLHGSSQTTIHGVTVTCKSRLCVRPKHISKFMNVLRALDTLGLTPDFYVIWDSLPYSFIVDWFIPVGDIADVTDKQRSIDQYWEVRDVCFSLEYTREYLNRQYVKCYTRWKSEVPPTLNGMYWLDQNTTSNETTLFRAIDAASIILKF